MLGAAVVVTVAAATLSRPGGCTAAPCAQVGTRMSHAPSPDVREPVPLTALAHIVARGTGPIAAMAMEHIAELRGAQPLSEPQQQALLITAEAVATTPTATGSARTTERRDALPMGARSR